MKYRKMGSLDWEVSALGFGCMRLPTKKENGNDVIDEEEAIKMIRYGIDNGVNYYDTAFPYHNQTSELVVGKALQDGYREKIKLVTKLPMWMLTERNDFDKYLNKQLEKLQTDHIDIYLFHGLNKQTFQLVKKYELIEKMEEAKTAGKIRHIGFSFHDSYDVYKEIIDYYNWDATQIQWNFVDHNTQATTKGLEYAAGKGIAVIVMEPIKGGKLANPTKEIEEIIEHAPVKRTAANWALEYVWNHPGVSVVLSGMSTFDQVKENIESAEKSGIDILSQEELKIISDMATRYRKKSIIPCTYCEYCQPCPSKVNIPLNFRLLNELIWADSTEQMRAKYKYFAVKEEDLNAMENNGAAALCAECGECLDKCPQMIDIPNELKKAHLVLGEDNELSGVYKLFLRGPVFVDKEEFQIIGIEDIGKRENRNTAAIWATFQQKITAVSSRDASHSLGIRIVSEELQKKGEERYIVSNEVSSTGIMPEGMITESIPAQKYAVFTHLGRLNNLGETYQYIYGDWLQNNTRYERVPLAAEFEWYDQRFNVNSDVSELDLYIPVREK
jgi:predicted aldo/keto reductase-like oxidoreductase/predicted transcriptional regulator YdeE